MRIAMVEPYYGGSHKAWADGYAARSGHEVVLLAHEARFWKWRMHGGFLTLAEQLADLAKDGWHPDVILASSMMDVAAFAGAIRRMAPAVPIATYFHESQFTYPLSPSDKIDFTYQMKNWASAAVSDLVIFNSEYHRSVFAAEASQFLNAFPDNKHVGMVDSVIDEAVVLPVGIDLAPFAGDPIRSDAVPLLLWNHRWEHDKGPKELKTIVAALIGNDVDFRMAMCGEVFVSVPPTFGEIAEMLGDRLIHEGHAERSSYESILREASVVLSTADQEFFGVGVIEAIAAGAHPVLPNRLVYPERIEALQADPTESLFDSPEQAADLITSHLTEPPNEDLKRVTAQYDWSSVAVQYDEALRELV